MVNLSCRWGRKIRKSKQKVVDGRGAGGSLDPLLGSFGELESMNRVGNIMLEKHLNSLNLGYQGQASLQQRKGTNIKTTELTPTHRYRRKIMNTSLCTNSASMPVPTLLNTHSLIFRRCCSPRSLATRLAAGYCETVQNFSSERVAHVGREDEPSATTTASAKAFEYLGFSNLLRNDP